MHPKRRKRLLLLLVLIGGLSLAVGLTLVALRDNINLFYTPSEIEAGDAPEDRRIRAGGLVEDDSVLRDPESLRVDFRITDTEGSVAVVYEGILPDLFREGQGVVALGTIQNGVFHADQVLAKHDEEYMPPEVAEALERAGKLKAERDSGESYDGYGYNDDKDGDNGKSYDYGYDDYGNNDNDE